MRTWIVLAVAATGCVEETNAGAPPARPEGVDCDVAAVGATGEQGVPLADGDAVLFTRGGQGGYHTTLGVVAHTGLTDIVLDVTIEDAQTGELLAEAPTTWVRLAGWDAESCEGWAASRTCIGGDDCSGSEANTATACAMPGRELLATMRFHPVENDAASAEFTLRGTGALDPSVSCP